MARSSLHFAVFKVSDILEPKLRRLPLEKCQDVLKSAEIGFRIDAQSLFHTSV